MLIFKCSRDGCGVGGGACIRCGQKGSRKPIQLLGQWKRHVRNTHNNKPKPETSNQQNEPASPNETEFPMQDDAMVIEGTPESITQDHERILQPEILELFGDDTILSREPYKWIKCGVRGVDLGFKEESRSALHFQQDYLANSTDDDGGMEYLVKRSMLLSANMEPGQFHTAGFQLPPGHVRLQMQIAELAFGMTPQEKERLVQVMNGSYRIGIENGCETARDVIQKEVKTLQFSTDSQAKLISEIVGNPKQTLVMANMTVKNAYEWSTRIPDDTNEIRRKYLEGAHSIVQNLPYPEIYTDVAGHSYLSITDCLHDFLAHKNSRKMAIIPNTLRQSLPTTITHTSESERAKELLTLVSSSDDHECVPTGYLFFWSDDLEPIDFQKLAVALCGLRP